MEHVIKEAAREERWINRYTKIACYRITFCTVKVNKWVDKVLFIFTLELNPVRKMYNWRMSRLTQFKSEPRQTPSVHCVFS